MEQDRGRSLYEPKFAEYQNGVGVATKAPRDAMDDAFKMFQTDYDLWRNQQRDVFDKLKWQSEFGLDAASR